MCELHLLTATTSRINTQSDFRQKVLAGLQNGDLVTVDVGSGAVDSRVAFEACGEVLSLVHVPGAEKVLHRAYERG